MNRREFRFDTPAAAINALVEALARVPGEQIAWRQAAGRILAQAITSDRESPPCDVSAMDGYAVHLADLKESSVRVAGQIRIGQPAPSMPSGQALKIVTGAAVPQEAQAVIPREQTLEEPGRFRPLADAQAIQVGQNIRRRGENLPAGAEVVPAGTSISPAVMAALATFGVARPWVYRRPCVGILTTGDEVLEVEGSPQPWQIRDSNGPSLRALISTCPWLELALSRHVNDDEKKIEDEIRGLLQDCDAILLTGGVSMGDYDHIPAVVDQVGCRRIFHTLPIRPGKPLLGAIGPQGQLVLGLPGNPLSVLTCASRFARPALARLAGSRDPAPPANIALQQPDQKRVGLWWYRPVKLNSDGSATLVSSRGSGDMVSAARSDGFVEIPPHSGGAGPWPFYTWEF